MRAFHNSKKIKDDYVLKVISHSSLNTAEKKIAHSAYCGCSIGIHISCGNSKICEHELGIPEWLALVEDGIVGELSPQRAITWPILFLKSITPGKNLETIKRPFLVYIVKSVLEKLKVDYFGQLKNYANIVIQFLEKETTSKKEVWKIIDEIEEMVNWRQIAIPNVSFIYTVSSAARSLAASIDPLQTERRSSSAKRSAQWDRMSGYCGGWEAIDPSEWVRRACFEAARFAQICSGGRKNAFKKEYNKFAKELIMILVMNK